MCPKTTVPSPIRFRAVPCTHYIMEHHNKTKGSEGELVIKSIEITVHARAICFIYCDL